jgi:hypothetical protein
MNDLPTDDKSFGPQLFPGGEPNPEWGVDELGCYARVQHQAIEDGERLLAPSYWRLGLALNLARRQFEHRQWGKYIEQLGINKARASRARAIHRTFEKIGDVVGLTVEEAYDRRERKQRKQRGGQSRETDEQQALAAFLDNVSQKADFFIDVAGFAEPMDAISLLPAVKEAIERLERIRDLLAQQSTM